jgi:hypothetical protein
VGQTTNQGFGAPEKQRGHPYPNRSQVDLKGKLQDSSSYDIGKKFNLQIMVKYER